MNALSNFAFEEHLVRVVDLNGEPWFVGNDVCRAIGLGNPRQAMSDLDDDERGVHNMDTPGNVQQMIVISEPGVYRLVFRSRKPEAERFKRWLAHDVLPAIRRTGRYVADVAADAAELADGDANLSARVYAVRTAERYWGRPAARALWVKLGLPTVPDMLAGPMAALPAVDSHLAEEAGDCLEHLLESKIGGTALRSWLAHLSQGYDDATALLLQKHGVRWEPTMFGEPGILIARRARRLGNHFAGTRWAGYGWGSVLLALPCARRSTKAAERYDGHASKSVFVPLRLLRLGPEAS